MVNLVDFRPKWPYSPHIWKFVGFLYDFWAILHDLRPIWAHSPHICKFCTQNSRETPHNPPYMQIHPIFWTFSLRKWHFIWWNCPKFLNILQHLIKNPKHFVKTPPGVGYICVFVRFLHVFVRFCAILRPKTPISPHIWEMHPKSHQIAPFLSIYNAHPLGL